MSELTDLDLMPFGKHKGQLMQDVPADYLHWIWGDGLKRMLERFNKGTMGILSSQEEKQIAVADYIKRNLAALAKDHPDGIW